MDDKTWLLGNINQTGYFRVNYDLQNWKLLIQQLQTNHQVRPSVRTAGCTSFEAIRRPFILKSEQILSALPVCPCHVLTAALSCLCSQIISVGNRAGLIDDAFNLAR